MQAFCTQLGHVLVQPQVNGRLAGWFILDTGASGLVIERDVADRLGLSSFGDVYVAGVGRKVRDPHLTLHSHPDPSTQTANLDLSPDPDHSRTRKQPQPLKLTKLLVCLTWHRLRDAKPQSMHVEHRGRNSGGTAASTSAITWNVLVSGPSSVTPRF